MVKRVVCREYHSCKTVNEADGKKKNKLQKTITPVQKLVQTNT